MSKTPRCELTRALKTTGIAVTTDDATSQRTVLAAVEIKHRAFTTKAAITQRRQHRRNRRGRLRYRAPRYDNRKRKHGTLSPSVDSLRSTPCASSKPC